MASSFCRRSFSLLLGEQSFERRGHAVEGAAEGAELVVAPHLDAMGEFAAVDLLGGAVELGDRAGDGAVEAHGHDEGDELEQGEDDGDADERVGMKAATLREAMNSLW